MEQRKNWILIDETSECPDHPAPKWSRCAHFEEYYIFILDVRPNDFYSHTVYMSGPKEQIAITKSIGEAEEWFNRFQSMLIKHQWKKENPKIESSWKDYEKIWP